MCIRRAVVVGGVMLAMTFGGSQVSAQGLYFDGGIGFGGGWTTIDGENVGDLLEDVSSIAVDVGFRVGYGPLANMPLYVVGEFSGMGHRFYDDDYYLQFNSYLLGPGVIYYPIPLLQVGASIGYSFTANDTNIPFMIMAESEGGFAWNISAAVDLSGTNNRGWLIGLKYFGAINALETKVDQGSGMIAVFFRYMLKN